MISSFTELNLLTQIQEALKELNFINPTPVQALVIPKMIEGIDIVARSQTIKKVRTAQVQRPSCWIVAQSITAKAGTPKCDGRDNGPSRK
ncbi:MAG: hypothetical protein Q8842_03050 [Candidatus Phytoplasma australasiaticum]|nr:hypothetical protein [Candidatus Phytoplasma australasiaticum]